MRSNPPVRVYYIRARSIRSAKKLEVENMKESQIERRLVRGVRAHGGLCYKFVSPGNIGVPDRIVITPGGRTIYIELKTKTGRMAEMQKWQRRELEKRGADVRALYGMDAVEAFLREVFGDAVHTA